jgi:alkyl hydroperoxide reductase subunit AhpC
LLQLQQAREELDRLEIQTLVVTFEGRREAREYLDETGLIWPLLVDTDRQLYRAYDMHAARLRHLWGFATMRAYGREALRGRFPRIPRADTAQQGGNVLIDPGGVVRLHHVGSGPADRPTVATVLAARGVVH